MSQAFFCSMAVALSLTVTHVYAQEFPEGSVAPPAAELQAILAGKTFDVKLPTGDNWRFQLDKNGFFYVDTPRGQDSGKWKTEDGKMCTEPRRSNASCNEMRLHGTNLLMKRDNGQIVQFIARQ
jgi:hypothetical protein